MSGMGRWEPDARGRLERAALELYVERGFEQTTVAEIARHAGLTERTFFRHFADKREVLFSGSSALVQLLAERIAAAPDDAPSMDVVGAALEAAGAVIQERGTWAAKRQAVIAANPELRERELIKLASLAAAMTDALRRRGVEDRTASLVAEVGIAAFRVAFEQWVQQPSKQDLSLLVRDSMTQVRAITSSK